LTTTPTPTTEAPAYFRPDALAERWAMTTKTLANWRTLGRGPAFVKIGGGLVRYALADVLAWEAEHRVTAVFA